MPLYHKFLLGLVLIILIIFEVLQFKWFSQSMSLDLEAYKRNLRGNLYQTVSREYQRLAPLLNDLAQIDPSENSSDAALKDKLHSIYKSYGPKGILQDLVKAIDIYDPVTARYLAPESLESSKSNPELFTALASLSKSNQETLFQGNIFLALKSEESSGSETLLLSGFSSQGRNLLIVSWIDLKYFFTSWIQPAVEHQLQNQNFAWDFEGPQNFRPSGIQRNSQVPFPERNDNPLKIEDAFSQPPQNPENPDFAPPPENLWINQNEEFHPLRILLGLEQSSQSVFRIPIPWYPDFHSPLLQNFRDKDDKISKADLPYFSDQLLRRITIVSLEDFHQFLPNTIWNLTVYLDKQSPLYTLKRRSALNWLFSTLLLLFIGAAFILLVLQMHKRSQLRQQEQEFVAAISHELRTPLTVISAAADNLYSGIVSPDRLGKYSLLIKENSARLAHLIDEVILFSKFEHSSIPKPQLQKIETESFFGPLIARLESLALLKGLTLEWDLKGLGKDFYAALDSLEFILENLITNSINHAYTKELAQGGLTKNTFPIRIQARKIIPDKINLIIEDDGCGIPSYEQKKIFQAFYRGERSKANQESGSGLGLYLVERKIHSLGGVLSLESPYKRVNGQKLSGTKISIELSSKGQQP